MLTAVYCTRQSNPKHKEYLIKTSGLHKNIEIIEIVNNGEALTKSYNRGLALAKNDIVVFLHDDIEFDNNNWGNKIIKHFEKYKDFGILGLAGTTDIPVSGRWWEDRQKMVGIVNHKQDGKKWESRYSKSWNDEIKEVVTVDGLFFAIHKQRIKNNFDEHIDGFHFYEIDFMLSNYLQGVKIGVMFNIRVTHMSVGMTNDEWERNRLQFVEKYKDKLPQNLVPEFYYHSEISNPDSKVKVKVIVQSHGVPEDFKILYTRIMSYNHPNLEILLVSDAKNYDTLKDVKFKGVRVYEGFYDTLPKNLSILKFEDDFITKDDELLFFMNENCELMTNIFSNFSKIYSRDKNSFGCGFPLSYNENKTIFSSRLDILTNKDGKIAINMKDSGSYYNVYNGFSETPFGNLSDCFVTTGGNIRALDWFKLNYETPLYFNEFALKLALRGKRVYTDTNSIVLQKSFVGQTTIQQDFQSLISFIGSEKKLQALVKLVQ